MKRIILMCILSSFCELAFSQQQHYLDNRPRATLRMDAVDDGIVLRYGNGKDSCDTYGAREAIVNEENGIYYLFYDGAGKDGWKACLAESKDLKNWTKKGAILGLGIEGSNDSKSASAPWVIKEKDTWHMFYLGTPNTSPAPDRIPAFPYLTMKAKSNSLRGPWVKQYHVEPLPLKKGTYYAVTASPGFIVKTDKEYLQFFSATTQDTISGIRRTLGIARTNDLDAPWKKDLKPIVPLNEQIENSSIYFDAKRKIWFLFTNHIGIDSLKTEYTDAIWVYWSKDINKWDVKNKAIVLDKNNCKWSKGTIGMPSVIKKGNKLAVLYDAYEGYSTYHMKRNIGLAWLNLPLNIPRK